MGVIIKADRQLKLGLNQNVIIFMVSILALGISEYFHLQTMSDFAWWICLLASTSLAFTVPAYTYRQCLDKITDHTKRETNEK